VKLQQVKRNLRNPDREFQLLLHPFSRVAKVIAAALALTACVLMLSVASFEQDHLKFEPADGQGLRRREY